jgi:hypothetical protein
VKDQFCTVKRLTKVGQLGCETASIVKKSAPSKDYMATKWYVKRMVSQLRMVVAPVTNSSSTTDRKIHRQALKYMVMDGELYRWTMDGLLLKCLGEEQSQIAMQEVHEGLCGTHQSTHKMKWTLRRAGCYWLTMMDDCIQYRRGCEACQKFGDVQIAPTSMLHPIIKPWSFRGWGFDFVEEIHLSSSKGHRIVLIATDYFTRWMKHVPLKNMTHKEVINFVLEHIIYQFRIPQTLTTDQGASFMSHQFREFVESLKIK